MSMATAKDSAPKLTELRLSYSIGVRVNLGNYQHGDAHLSRGETWDVTGMTEDETTEFYEVRIAALNEELGDLIEAEQEEMLGNNNNQDEEDD